MNKIKQFWVKFQIGYTWSKFFKFAIKIGSFIIFIVTITTLLYDIETNIDNDANQKMNDLIKYVFQYRQNQDLLEHYLSKPNSNKSDFQLMDQIQRNYENNSIIYLIETNLDEKNPFSKELLNKIRNQDEYLKKVNSDSKLGGTAEGYIPADDLKETVKKYQTYQDNKINGLSFFEKYSK